MAVVSFTIPAGEVNRVQDAFAARFGWVSVAVNGTKAEFARQRIIAFVKDIVFAHERDVAQSAAATALATPPDLT